MFDGGDCLGDPNNIKMGFGGDNSVNFHWMNDSAELQDKPYCAENCLDLWLSDSFCDTSCKSVLQCSLKLSLIFTTLVLVALHLPLEPNWRLARLEVHLLCKI